MIGRGDRVSDGRGFTLIELLVVIAIIAILAAPLFPVYSKMKASARKTTCICNQRQLSLAFVQYLDEYDERYPVPSLLAAAPRW